MKIIFTYCNPANRVTKPTEFLHNLARLSSGSVKKFTDYKTELYIDPKQNRWFKDIEYFDDIIKVDYFEDDFDPRYWNYPKLKTYSLQNEPFLHMDLDMVIVPGFFVPDNTDLVCENVRTLEPNEKCYRHAYSNVGVPRDIICSGMLGGNTELAFSLFKYQYEKAKLECKSGLHETVEFPDLYSMEEVSFTQMAILNDMTVSTIMMSKFIHFQGADKEKVFDAEVKRLLKNFKL